MTKVKFLQSAYVWSLKQPFRKQQEVEFEDINLVNRLVKDEAVEIIDTPKPTKLKKGE